MDDDGHVESRKRAEASSWHPRRRTRPDSTWPLAEGYEGFIAGGKSDPEVKPEGFPAIGPGLSEAAPGVGRRKENPTPDGVAERFFKVLS